MDRKECPSCGAAETQFIQFASGDENTVWADAEDVAGGILELRWCIGCGSGVENILTLSDRVVITHENENEDEQETEEPQP